jgi:hypothetical protein
VASFSAAVTSLVCPKRASLSCDHHSLDPPTLVSRSRLGHGAARLRHVNRSEDAAAPWVDGGCHCGAVRFRVRVRRWQAVDCNCSICTKKGFLHLIVGREDFELGSGEAELTTYRFNTGVAQHRFCSVCGIHGYYVPRSHPDGVDVNVRCLDDAAARARFRVEPFDGQRWEDSVHELR